MKTSNFIVTGVCLLLNTFSVKLFTQVSGPLEVGGNEYAFYFNADPNYGLYFNLADTRYEFTNGQAQRLFSVDAFTGAGWIEGGLQSNGNIGIGTTIPVSSRLEISKTFSGLNSSDFAMQKLRLGFAPGTIHHGNITGLDIKLSSPKQDTYLDGDIVGLKIDVDQYNGFGEPAKYAALFNGGNVGIGSSRPTEMLEVAGGVIIGYTDGQSPGTIRWTGTDFQGFNGTSWQSFLGFNPNSHWSQNPVGIHYQTGNVGIGTSNPLADFHVSGSMILDNTTEGLQIGKTHIGFGHGWLRYGGNNSGGGSQHFAIGFQPQWNIGSGTAPRARIVLQKKQNVDDSFIAFETQVDGVTFPQEQMRIDANGFVGIGTTSPSYMLDVCGTIRSKEIIVETGWCDYVFDPDYDLMTLHDTKRFIEKNKHLPGIPNEEVIEKEGLKLSEITARQMEKIEELFLHIIEMNERMEQIEKE